MAELTIAKLVTTPARLLGVYDVQKRYISLTLGQKARCPFCSTPQNWFEAHHIDPTTTTYDEALGESSSIDRVTTCRNDECGRKIKHVLPFMGGWFWMTAELMPVKERE